MEVNFFRNRTVLHIAQGFLHKTDILQTQNPVISMDKKAKELWQHLRPLRKFK